MCFRANNRNTTSAGGPLSPARLAFLTALGQSLAHDFDQSGIFQNRIAVTHPGFPQIGNLFGDKAVGESGLRPAGFNHDPASAAGRDLCAVVAG